MSALTLCAICALPPLACKCFQPMYFEKSDSAPSAHPRALVAWFGGIQERKLLEHDGKGEWATMSYLLLFWLLLVEVAELAWAIVTRAPAEEVDNEAGDVANLAMFICDRYKGATGSRNRGRNL